LAPIVFHSPLERAEADLRAIDAAHAASIRDQAKEGGAIEPGKPLASAKAEIALR
jgi:hypothetical protein